jgi:acetoacetyl-CoA synthetase
MSLTKKLWSPDKKFTENSNMYKYMQWVNNIYQEDFKNYQDLWEWSTTKTELFWISIIKFYNIQYSGSFDDVLSKNTKMHETKWFDGISLNYAEHVFTNESTISPAIIFKNETNELTEISWESFKNQTAKLAKYLRDTGIKKGDRICCMLPNTPESVIAFLATNAIGAIWSSCSPDFGTKSIVDRFKQIEPKVFITANAYSYNGKVYDKRNTVKEIMQSLSSLKKTISVNYISTSKAVEGNGIISWESIQDKPSVALKFERVEFSHPIWVLYSSGTTGKPKAITHSSGGILIEHYKAMGLHQNIKPGERFFWFSTTGWMMWNYANSALLVGGTLAIYDGSPTYPENKVLWKFAQEAELDHFGAGATFYIHCMREGLSFNHNEAIQKIKSFGSTGSPLPPETFDWFYKQVNSNAWVISLSGGTDICSGFVGGNPLEPVYSGEIQCRMLGVDLKAYSENGTAVYNELGEMVIEKPMPSMPVFFWNDIHHKRYLSSYFEMYPNIWRHGDWIKITPKNSLIIYGRSDATLNRGGIRVGTSEIYSAVESIEEISDSLVVCVDHEDGTQYMPIFVVLNNGAELNNVLIEKLKTTIQTQFSPRHVPDDFIVIKEVPYTISGKKMETPVKKIMMGLPIEKAVSKDAMRNPDSLSFFENIKK